MKRKLLLKLIIAVIIYGVGGFLLITFFGGKIIGDTAIISESSKLYREAMSISQRYAGAYYSGKVTAEELDKELRVLAAYNAGQIWLIDRGGKVGAASTIYSDEDAFTIEGFNTLDFGNEYYRTSDFYGYFSEPQLSVYMPVSLQFMVRGYVIIHVPLGNVYATANEYLNVCYVIYIALFALAVLLILLYLLDTYRKIVIINIGIKKYMNGEYEKPLKAGDDELGFIGASFNYMANELDTLEDDQKKLISNVSHDFRSPLTSIRGYLDAIMDGTIPPEMQGKYLGIIYSETERLTKLTSGLLELNQYGSHGKAILNIEDFDINQIVRQTAATFGGICEKRNIVLELVLTGNELMVKGDKTKLGQVVYNLTDNAIKFSNNDSVIKLETLVKYDKVFVSVKDNGIGIPKESIGKVFERFYKSDLSRGKDKKGTGLGLSIVKEIIQAHGENINVISTEGVGTEFIFTLESAETETIE